MPIQESNIVFVRSQVMDDVPEGGGAATGTVIIDGQMNNVFEDISDLDRAYGRFNLRKIFLAVRTLSTDLYGGAKTVITALPQDDALGYALFSQADPFDTRTEAANRVAAYLYKGPMWEGYLYENHIVGMRTINLIQRVGGTLPTIGKTLCLVQDEGLAGEKEQYVRVTKVEVQENTFNTNTSAAFTRWIVTLTLSDALRFDFTGHTPTATESSINYTGKTRVRNTSVADATRYYGAQRLATASNIGDLTVRAESLFAKLVPSAQTETPLVTQRMNQDVVATYSTGTRSVEIAQQAHTLARDVTAENRRLNWIETLLPIPTPGALSISFRAQGNWYVLRDNGAGTLAGSDPSIGAGTINYTTGAAAITLGALPDAGSQVMFAWASPAHYEIKAGATANASTTVRITHKTANAPVVPGSVTLSYSIAGAAKTATDGVGNGNIEGDSIVSGTINYATGEIVVTLSALPTAGAVPSVAYTWRDGLDLTVTLDGATAVVGGAFNVPGSAPFRNGGEMTLLVTHPSMANTPAPAYIKVDGSVWVREYARPVIEGKTDLYYRILEQQVGTFSASTGVVTLAAPTLLIQTVQWGILPKAWFPTGGVQGTIVSASGITVERDGVTFDPNAVTGELVAVSTTGLEIDLLTTTVGGIVPDSVRFALGGKTYDDRNGVLYTDIDAQTGSGTAAGTMDYAAGKAYVTLWGAGSAAPTVTSCLVRFGQWTATEASFRAALAPLKPEALSITATAANGEVLTASADADGDIVGTKVRGTVNYEFGTAQVEFGQMGDDPNYTGPAPIPQVWFPIEVIPETIRYNAVAYSYLPLDANILGIDPVRLPSDGRVPIYRPGDVVMVMHTAETAPQTVSNGGTINLGRTRIGWVRVIDATGASKPTGYTLDRATGIVTFTDVSGMTMPIKVRHTVGDLRQITDAQITGQLTLARPLTHAYPAGEAIVASCLIHGDRRARVSSVWDQATWNGTWSDSLVGSEATATLDVIAHPIEVTNEGAETERWLLRWTSTTNVELIGQRRGLVFSGPFTADIAPINPRTRNVDGTGGVPYLHIPLAANGGGWSAGNVVRINTVGALADIWIARSIQQSDEPLGDGEDGVELYALGNIDRP